MIRKIMHRPQAVLGLAMMLLVFLVMLLAPVFAPNDPMQLNVAHSFASNSSVGSAILREALAP